MAEQEQVFRIRGGAQLKGNILISGSKNASLALIAASLLVDKLTLDNVPKLNDILDMKAFLESFGSKIDLEPDEHGLRMVIDNTKVQPTTFINKIASKFRASIYVLGSMLARFGHAKVELPGGCSIGERKIDLHLEVLKTLGGIEETVALNEVKLKAKYPLKRCYTLLKSTNFKFGKVSLGATVNALLASSLAQGETLLSNCALDPEIIDLCELLRNMGSQLTVHQDRREIRIVGQKQLKNDIVYTLIPDRIEAGTYMIAAVITRGDITLHGALYEWHLGTFIEKLRAIGTQIDVLQNGFRVRHIGEIHPVDIETGPFPEAFDTDLQSPFMSVLALCSGVSTIKETVYEKRLRKHAKELEIFGAKIDLLSDTEAKVSGVKSFRANNKQEIRLVGGDLRSTAALVLAALACDAEIQVKGIRHLERGYCDMEKKLRSCGANIVKVGTKQV